MNTDSMGSIYCITCIPTGKKYVGLTRQNPNARWAQHVCDAGRYNECVKLGRAINKYGRDNFSREILETVPFENLNEREIYWIARLNSVDEGLNCERGGKSIPLSEETKRKLSLAMTGRRDSLETRRKKSLSLFGRPVSEETRAKQRLSAIKRGTSPERLAKLIEGNLRNTRSIRVTSLCGEAPKTFSSCAEFARSIGDDPRAVANNVSRGFTHFRKKWNLAYV